MTITVRLFAQQRQLTGWKIRPLELPVGSPISAAWTALVQQWPGLAAGTDSVRFARNAVYAAIDDTLSDGDELAVIPPVAGGAGHPCACPTVTPRGPTTDAAGQTMTAVGRT